MKPHTKDQQVACAPLIQCFGSELYSKYFHVFLELTEINPCAMSIMKMCPTTAECKHKIHRQMLKVRMASVKNGLLTFRILMRYVLVHG
jgi:uncharacterized membrane protein